MRHLGVRIQQLFAFVAYTGLTQCTICAVTFSCAYLSKSKGILYETTITKEDKTQAAIGRNTNVNNFVKLPKTKHLLNAA